MERKIITKKKIILKIARLTRVLHTVLAQKAAKELPMEKVGIITV